MFLNAWSVQKSVFNYVMDYTLGFPLLRETENSNFMCAEYKFHVILILKI